MAIITRGDVELEMLGVMPLLETISDVTLQRAFDSAISAAHAHLEERLEMCIEPTVIMMDPPATLTAGEDYDRTEPALDYRVGDFSRRSLPKWTLRRRPVISVQSVRLGFGPESAATMLTVPASWVRVNKPLGVINVVPSGRDTVMAGSMGIWFAPLLDKAWAWNIIPQFVYIDYTAGNPNATTDPEWGELRNVLATEAAIVMLERVVRLLPASVSLDGFSQSFTDVERHVEMLRKDVDTFIKRWRARYHPPIMAVI